MTDATRNADVVIIGAGPVGMALAGALRGNQRVLLIDRRPRGAWASDPRVLAVAHGSRQLLERLKAWDSGCATPIRDIHVSQRGGFGRTRIQADDYSLPALGYVMRYCDLAATLDLRLDNEQLLSSSEVTDVQPDNEHVRLTLRQKGAVRHVSAKLLVHAEGSPADSPECWEHDYRQHAIIAELRPAQAHGNRAWERFTPEGPLALLPFGENYALVMTVPAQQAEALLQLDDPGFLATLRERCGRQLDFISTSPRRAFPLALRLRKTLVRQRQVWIGNTAQTLHPVTGQGFNLGLRDAWELAEALQNNPSSDPGDTAMLAAYARNRQPDRLLGAALTDGFVRLFSNDYLPLKIARGLGLLSIDLCPPLRHLIARQMNTGTRSSPR